MIKFLGFNHIATAFSSFRANKFRTALTIVGISVGIGLLTLIVALQTTFTKMTDRQVNGFYRDRVLVIKPQQAKTKSLFNLNTSNNEGFKVVDFLDETDLQAISKVPGVKTIAPLLHIETNVQARQKSHQHQTIIATTPDFLKTVNLKINKGGQFLDDDIIPNAAVIGKSLANRWYDVEQVIGHTFQVQDYSFTIVGVFDDQQTLDGHGTDFSQVAIVNLAAANQISRELGLLNQINVVIDDQKNEAQIKAKINQVLEKNHSVAHSFDVLSPAQIQQQQTDQIKPLIEVVNTMAIIALVIGAIGVMNIMLVNVSERTHEIGVRRTIGATSLNIVNQYLIESVLFCLVGGVIGVGLAIVAWFVIQTQLGFGLEVVFDWMVIVKMLVIASLIGMVAGLIPSLRAASKDPIESLRKF